MSDPEVPLERDTSIGATSLDLDRIKTMDLGAPRADDDLTPGSTLGHFTISGLLGRGGMGVVFRAVDDRLRRQVALKVLPASLTSDPERQARFLHEARAAAAVSHPNIAVIYEVGEGGGRLFIAMELIEGLTLRERMAQGMSLSEGLPKLVQIARAIESAHEIGVCHRDLKPDNVMIGRDGDVKILDFGLAKQIPAGGAEGPGVTKLGMIMGSPGYMSPEQALGQPTDHRTDIYSLGVILYELSTGNRPFSGTAQDMMMAVVREDPLPPSSHNPELAPRLERIIMRCLERSPGERYAHARALAADLEELLATPAVDPPRPESAPRPSRSALLAALKTPQGELPTGKVTLLRAEIYYDAGTPLDRLAVEHYDEITKRFQQVAHRAIDDQRGKLIDVASDGILAVFVLAEEAAAAGVTLQRAVVATPWSGGAQVRMRVGLHTGEPKLSAGRYIGLDVHRAARIAETARCGQILLSAATRDHLTPEEWGAAPDPLASVVVRDLGTHRLVDLRYPEHLFELIGPGLPEGASPVSTMISRPINLPGSATTFIGRRRELSGLQALLRRADVHLVTLTGPGGTGKTRLAIEAARSLAVELADATLVSLAPVRDPGLVLSTIAQALGASEPSGRPIIDVLKAQLAGPARLLVIDNFEHVMAAAQGIAELISACPRLKILVTSQQPLRIGGEHEFAVPCLELPGEDLPEGEDISRYDAVQLFLNRMRHVHPGVVLTPENAPLIAAICTRLDGLPLAIELGASRTKILSLRALLERLGDRLGFLKGGRRDMAARHQTLRAAIDWSFGLLDEADQCLFRRVAVFSGGFTIEAAEEVCGFDAPVPIHAFDGLSSLADKSLLTRTEVEGDIRLGMLETIREYAAAILAGSMDLTEARARHAMYFLALAETNKADLMGHNQRQAVSRLLLEADNLRAALTWAMEQPSADITSQFVEALLWFWIVHGKISEGRAWSARAIEQARLDGETEARGRILGVVAWLYAYSGDYEGAHALCVESEAILQKLGRDGEGARTRILLGLTGAVAGDPTGMERMTTATAECRARGDLYGAGLGLVTLGELARAFGRLDEARGHYEGAIEIMRRLSNVFWLAALMHNMAHFHLHDGDWRAAAEQLKGTLDLAVEYNHSVLVAVYLAAMGGVAVVRGKPEEGARLIGAADAQFAALGAHFEPADQAERDRHYAAAESALGSMAVQVAREEGASWSRDRAIAESLALRN